MDLRVTSLFLAVNLGIFPAAYAQSSRAQSTEPPRVAVLAGFGPAGNLISGQPHAPFSGVVVQRWEQTLSDGTHISKEIQETVMRDDAGRIYRARTIDVPRGRTHTEPRLMITIADPVLHVQYVCSPVGICRQMRYDPRDKHWLRGPDPKKMPDTSVEDLGSSEISGIEAQGTRVTRVVPEGAAGNDRPLTIMEELWHSKQLGIDLQVMKTDPRWGNRTTTISDIIRAEPDPKYFQIPEGYKVVAATTMHGSSSRMGMSPVPMEGQDPNMARMAATKP